MPKYYKSIWNDFLLLIGVIPIGKLEKNQANNSFRRGYPSEFLERLSDSDRKTIHEDSLQMEKIN